MQQKIVLLVSMLMLLFIPSLMVISSTHSSTIIIPQVVFFHPEGLVNGSSFIPRDYIYFTLSGNLQDWEANTYGDDWWIDYKWDFDEYVLRAEMKNGIWLINPFFQGKFIWNCWHNLTLFFKVHEGYIHSEIHQFYADPNLIEPEPMSITPVNYPNNSVIPHLGGGDYHTFPTFHATGYTPIIESWQSTEEHFFKKKLNCSYRWDEEEWWEAYKPFRRDRTNDYVSYHPNIYTALLNFVSADGKEHSLDIRITNGSHTEIYRYYYTIVDYFDIRKTIGLNYGITCRPDNDPSTYGVGGEDHLSSRDTIAFINSMNSSLLIYNWLDGNGNHTTLWNDSIYVISHDNIEYYLGIKVSAPDFSPEETGVRYFSFWIEKMDYWFPEFRHVYYYDRLIPEINLIYPKNDSVKTSRIPLIWSLDTYAKGFWDFSEYKFDLYYETPTQPPTLITSNYNYIVYQTKTKINTYNHWYLKDLVNYFRNCSDPMLLGYEFAISDELAENTDQIRFIIEETTRGDIPPVVSEWLSIAPKIIREESTPITEHSPTTTEETTLPVETTERNSTTELQTKYVSDPEESSSSMANKSSWVFNLSLILIGIVILRKRRND